MLRSTSTWVRYPCTCDEEERMAGLMSRASMIIKAKFSALLGRAENPRETLDYSYERQLQSLQDVKRGVADVVTAKKRLQLQTQQLEQNLVKLDTQARQALAVGREDLARQALERKSGVQQQLQGLDGQIKGLEDQQDELVAAGSLDDLTSNQTQLDRELAQLSSQSQVDQELERLKAEVGSGAAPQKELDQAEPEAQPEPQESRQQESGG